MVKNEKIRVYTERKKIIAIVIKSNFKKEGMEFFTPESFPQQLAYVHHKKGKIIRPHIHNIVKREICFTQEVDIIKKGKIKVNLYSNDKQLLDTFILESGDVVLFACGGHGYEVLEDVELILVKQGPYLTEKDKTYIEKT